MQGFASAARKAALVSVSLSSMVFVLAMLAFVLSGEALVRLETPILLGLLGLVALPPVTWVLWQCDRGHRRRWIRHEGESRLLDATRHRHQDRGERLPESGRVGSIRHEEEGTPV